MIRRLLLSVCAIMTAAFFGAVSAGATIPTQGKVGPNEYFGGLVNANNGNTARAPIHMACFGAIKPGQKGHPMAGQTVEVFRPEVILVHHSGYTGKRADHIVALFGPSPSATPVANTVTFTQFGVNKPIPTSLLLPCAGTGTVTFTSAPASRTSHAATVPVSYIGQP